MNSHHLTADELDSFLSRICSETVTSHVATCPECAMMVERDRRLLAALSALPQFAPSPVFGEAVLSRIAAIPAPAVAVSGPDTARSQAARRRALGAMLVVGSGVAAGFVWANAHPADALSWSAPALRDFGHTMWLSLQGIVANATEQPWFATLRDTLGTPIRALALVAGTAAAYAIGLVSLRRLMTEPATNASW